MPPGYLSSAEVYGVNGWSPINQSFPEGILNSCSITVNESMILLTGGILINLFLRFLSTGYDMFTRVVFAENTLLKGRAQYG
jgi:hypothetical protein